MQSKPDYKRSMINLSCGMLALVLMACGVANAIEPAAIELRKTNAIGRLGLVTVHVAVKAEADASAVVSFQALQPATYVFISTTGSERGKTAPLAVATDDASLQTKLDRAIRDDPSLDAARITATVIDGKATLNGAVPTEALKTRAERLAHAVKGIRSVDNRITIVPNS